VPKQGKVDHHEVLRVPQFYICCIFCFCDVLLLTSDDFCFSFFMVVTTFGVDQKGIFQLFRACGQ
jgi:hypothetical protein